VPGLAGWLVQPSTKRETANSVHGGCKSTTTKYQEVQ